MQSHEVPCSALLRLGNQNQSAEYMRVRRQVLENTYIMKPQEHEKFRANEVIKAVKALLDERLKVSCALSSSLIFDFGCLLII